VSTWDAADRPLLVTGGRLWPAARWAGADAVFVRGGRISAIGRTRDLVAAVPGATRIDARGATVTPGLCDAHLHFVPWAQGRRQPDLLGAATRAEALARVDRALGEMTGDAPLVGRGWDEMGWEARPDRTSLDALAAVRPVVLHSHDFHSVWANSAALRAAGVTRATVDPAGGCFERDGSGEPTGIVRENAVSVFAALEAQAGPEITAAVLDDAAAALHAAGITAVHDFQRNAADMARMRALAGRRRLRVLQHVGEEQLAQLSAAGLASGVGDAWFRVGALKLFADGALGSRTAALLEPYDDGHGLGMVTIPREELIAIVRRAAEAGFASAIHAIGDRAVRHALDAFEAARAAAPAPPLPPRIEHVQLLHPDDLPRFAALGVAASMQPQHATSDAFAATAAWGARCALGYPWRSLHESGVLLAFGSDAPVEPPLAWLGLHAAVTRTRPDGTPPGGFVPEQRIGLDQALRAYTEGAASLAGLAGQLGTLEPGAEADLVVWDRNLHAVPPEVLPLARPAITVLGGEIVYVSPVSGSAVTAAGRRAAPGGGL
jgi:predicted amidohydrolase YtcJ